MSYKYLLRPDPPDMRDFLYASPHFQSAAQLPKSVDLRSNCSNVVDQLSLGSCTANAIASGLLEYVQLAQKKPLVPMSRLWFYYMERLAENTVDEDAGASLRDGMKIASVQGCVPEQEWPYDITKLADAPPSTIASDGAPYKITSYHRVSDLMGVKAALASGHPVVMGAVIYSSFESSSVARTGLVPMPKKHEKQLGGHALLAVGYQDDKKHVIVRNSWGQWGDKGYCYFPYEYFGTAFISGSFNSLISDLWVGM